MQKNEGKQPEPKRRIVIIRLGHRLPRDERMTTHVALVARALGADEMVYGGQHDQSLEESVTRVAEKWGGRFTIRYERDPIRTMRELKKQGFATVHLTMYGIPLSECLGKIKKHGCIAIVVGGEQVPPEVYERADYNIAITSQPHSEVAALAIALERLQEGAALERAWNERFEGKIRITPNARGKDVRSEEK